MSVVAFESVWDRQVSELDEQGLRDRFQMLERERRHIEAELGEVIGQVDRSRVFRADGHSTVRGWCRALGRWSDPETTARVRSSRLAHAFPVVAAALAVGDLGVSQRDELGRVYANPRVVDHLGGVIDMFLEQSRLVSFEEFAKIVRRWEAFVDVDGSERAHAVSHRRRQARMFLDDTTMVLRASGGSADGAEMQEIFDRYQDAEFRTDWAAARAVHGDDTQAAAASLARTVAQRGWDALRQIFRDAASSPPGSRAPEPVVNIVADVETYQEALRDLATQLATGDAGGTGDSWLGSRGGDPRWWRSGTTSGVPLSRAAVIEAILLGRVRRVVTDGEGVAVDVGRKRRFFTGAMRDAVMMLTETCVFAGCSRPSGQCAADHTIDHQHGGHTSTRNADPMCASHNLIKNQGFTVWRDPGGFWHTHRPDGTEIR